MLSWEESDVNCLGTLTRQFLRVSVGLCHAPRIGRPRGPGGKPLGRLLATPSLTKLIATVAAPNATISSSVLRDVVQENPHKTSSVISLQDPIIISLADQL